MTNFLNKGLKQVKLKNFTEGEEFKTYYAGITPKMVSEGKGDKAVFRMEGCIQSDGDIAIKRGNYKVESQSETESISMQVESQTESILDGNYKLETESISMQRYALSFCVGVAQSI